MIKKVKLEIVLKLKLNNQNNHFFFNNSLKLPEGDTINIMIINARVLKSNDGPFEGLMPMMLPVFLLTMNTRSLRLQLLIGIPVLFFLFFLPKTGRVLASFFLALPTG